MPDTASREHPAVGKTSQDLCINCGSSLQPFIDDIKDYEYGVKWSSVFVKCPKCGLVTQEPRVQGGEIPKLYPDSYFVHSSASLAISGIYGTLKNQLDKQKIRKVSNFLPEGGSFLEVGCGNGSFLKTLQRVRPDGILHGVDIKDPGALDASGIRFYKGLLEDARFETASMDVAFFDELIEHVEAPIAFLEECHRILRPKGIVYGITPDHLSLDRVLFGKYWAGYHYPRHTFLFDHHNLPQILSKAAFETISLKGSRGLWIRSMKNLLMKLPGTKKRGIAHYGGTILFYPVDMAINLFRCHGEMTFIARKKAE